MCPEALKEQRWWLETWRHLGVDPERARVVRATGDALCERSFWNLIHAELVVLGANSAERSEIHGRLGLAVLLQVVLRVSPRDLGPLVQAISERERLVDFDNVVALAGPMFRVLETFRRLLARGDEDVMQTLAGHGEIVVWDGAASGADRDARMHQGRYILAYRDATDGLREQRIGVVAAARWACDDTMKARLERVGGRLDARMLFIDLIAIGVLAALRFRLRLAARGLSLPVPDIRAFLAARAQIERALAEPDVAEPPRAQTPPVIEAEPFEEASDPPPADTGNDGLHKAASEPLSKPEEPVDEWLLAARQWASDRPQRLEHLFEIAARLETSRLWPELAKDVARLVPLRTLRPQEGARLGLATLLDEAFRALPASDYLDLLDGLALDPCEIVRARDCGRTWQSLEPLFVGWARQLDPEVKPEDKGLVIRTLSRCGDILPWDDDAKGSPEKRRKSQDAAIDAVYGSGGKEPGGVRRAIFWCATRARNDHAHQNADSLAGRVRPTDLLTDVVALAAQATLRFRARLAEDSRSQASVPSMRGLSALLGWLGRRRAR